jgi:riboflavin synthase
MFTGIIEETGTVSEIVKSGNSMRITVRAKIVLENTKPGDSIAVNGICVTVTKLSDKSLSADISPETIERTSLQHVKTGESVNLERALSPVSRIGGHFVTGHIDGTGRIDSIITETGFLKFVISTAENLSKYIASKGSIALNGVSLTPYDCTKDTFSVMIIPHTLDSTNLNTLHTGDVINIECDILSKYVERLLLNQGSSPIDKETSRKIDSEFLKRTGFLV